MNVASLVPAVPIALSAAATTSRQLPKTVGSFLSYLASAIDQQRPDGDQQIKSAPDELGIRPAPSHQALANAALQASYRRLLDRLRQHGVDTSINVQLQLQPEVGKVEVVGNHPDRQRIEQLLEQEVELTDMIRHLAETFEQLSVDGARVERSGSGRLSDHVLTNLTVLTDLTRRTDQLLGASSIFTLLVNENSAEVFVQ